jgi:hypothetical protein
VTRRERFRVGLSSLYLPIYDALCDSLPEHWQPYCGLRTVEEQNALWAQGRSKPGKIITKAKGGTSAHNYGCASDWTIFEDGKPMWPDATDPLWKQYQDAIRAAGGVWGADWDNDGQISDEKFLDAPHNELGLTCAWSQVYLVLSQGGMRAAQEFISLRRKVLETPPTTPHT